MSKSAFSAFISRNLNYDPTFDMQLPEWLKVIFLGIIEGLTEFLPVSSTGHLMVFQEWMNFNSEVFTVFIQLGALTAVWWLFRARILTMLPYPVAHRPQAFKLALQVFLGFTPVLLIGYLTRNYRDHSLSVIAWATFLGGFAILAIEYAKPRPTIATLDAINHKTALLIGLGQCLSLCPGVSRSGATIMAALLLGLSRPVATEFTFLLAIPTMTAATVYELIKYRHDLSFSMISHLLLGSAVSFLVAWGVVKWFIHFVQRHDFIPFAWYRILAGGLLLIFLYWKILTP